MLELVDSDLYFVQDKNNFINPLLQVGSGPGSVEKSSGSGSSSLKKSFHLVHFLGRHHLGGHGGLHRRLQRDVPGTSHKQMLDESFIPVNRL